MMKEKLRMLLYICMLLSLAFVLYAKEEKSYTISVTIPKIDLKIQTKEESSLKANPAEEKPSQKQNRLITTIYQKP
ncbi:MAG: hypothetical protein JW867_00890 [Candidatus Omnitrophica bacterium]|nr:hypothetical protein [Candidatus Omnitrophota bacterium]